MSDKDAIEEAKVSFVRDFVADCKENTERVREKWRENKRQFAFGSQFDGKADWQSNFSLGVYETRIRAAAGKARQIIINQPDWFEVEAVSGKNEQAEQLAPLFKKIILYDLESAKFFKKIHTLLLNSYTNMGCAYVGLTQRFIQNPDYVKWKYEQDRMKEQVELAKTGEVENPFMEEASTKELADLITRGPAEFDSILYDDNRAIEAPEPKQYLQINSVSLEVIDPEDRFWDDHVQYMEDSKRNGFASMLPEWELKQWAKYGFFDKKAVDKTSENKSTRRTYDQRAALDGRRRTVDTSQVDLFTYFGPYVKDGEIQQDDWGCIVANDGTIVKEFSSYPYWEPPKHNKSPFIDLAVKEVPGRPTGSGAGDNAVLMARWLDSNVNMANDAMRFNMAGITTVDYTKLVDQNILESGGVAPGQIIETRGNPGDVVKHINLTNSVENQWAPVNELLSQKIDEQLGTNDMALGGPTRRSRVTAAETNARLQGAEAQINSTALDIEQGLLIPLIEKFFARRLQIGFSSIDSDPGLKERLNDSEVQLLKSLEITNRMEILNSWYKVKIVGFSSEVDRNEKINDFNEMFAIVGQQANLLGQIVNVQELFKDWLKANNIKEPERYIFTQTELETIVRENQLLSEGRSVAIMEDDNHEMHIQSHQALANSPLGGPAASQHLQQHMKFIEQQQAAAKQSQQLDKGNKNKGAKVTK